MRRKMFQKAICFILSVTTLLGAFGITASAGSYKENNPAIPTLSDMAAVAGIVSYETYLKAYPEFDADRQAGLGNIVLDANDILLESSTAVAVKDSDKCVDYENAEKWPGFGNNGDAVYLPSTGSTVWTVDITPEMVGYYNIVIEYYSCNTSESSNTNIERKLLIDGKVPFSEVSTITLNKFWKYTNVKTEEFDAPGEPDSSTTESKHITKDKDGTPGYYKIVTTVKNGKKTVTTYTLSQDVNGNSMSPTMESEPQWATYECSDSTGYYDGAFSFYMAEGTRKIELSAEREPVVIKSVQLIPADDAKVSITAPAYAELVSKYQAQNASAPADGQIVKIEAEFPDMVSDTSVVPTADGTSAATFPRSAKADVFNVIGEQSYSTVGQWAAYKFTVSKSGLYKLGMRFKQDALQGMFICRTLKLAGHSDTASPDSLGYYGLGDGTATVPFKEAYDIRFNYDKEWQSSYLGDASGNSFEFYFEEGVEYTMYLECSLGSLKEYIKRVENVLNSSNDAYLKIVQYISPTPDEGRPYDFINVMPEVLMTLLENAIELDNVREDLKRICGTNGSHIATLDTVARSINETGSDTGNNIASNLSTFKSYLGTLGTWVNDSKQGKLLVDSIQVFPANESDKALLKAKPNFFVSLWHEISSFFYSFFTDYDQMGLTVVPEEGAEAIDVWLAKGRDQSAIWRSMIDTKGKGFTDQTGIAVKLRLVAGGTLLPSILSGKGPDVYMELPSSEVINYAIRDAILPTDGPDADAKFKNTYYTYRKADGTYIKDVTAPLTDADLTLSFVSKPYLESMNMHDTDKSNDLYSEAAIDTITLYGSRYGVPMTMTFAMMFYRMDVLADIKAELPDTWEGMLEMMPKLQANNMEIGVSYVSALDFMLYQRGGNMWKYTDKDINGNNIYEENVAGAKIGLDTKIALQAFDFTCGLFTKHSFPVSFDSANRFRTGEMPIQIGDYISFYNSLVVFATELEGLWSFCSLPGSIDDDGNYNYDSLAGVSATVILHGCDNILGAWKFTQWQTSEDVQAEYGNGMVAIIGPSAKYEAANLNAIDKLSWSASEKIAIYDQLAHMKSIVNYPGSYYIGRYTKFAFLDAVNKKIDPSTAMREYIGAINAEINRKREEFGLPTFEADEEPTPIRQQTTES